MQIHTTLPQLAQALPNAAPSDWVDLPIDARERLEAVGNTTPTAVLTDPSTRWLQRAADAAPRHGYAPWLPVAVLQAMAWPAGDEVHSPAWQAFMQAEWGKGSRFAGDANVWPDGEVPAPAWPDLPPEPPQNAAALDAHLQLWAQGLRAKAWMDMAPLQPTPCSQAELSLCEWRLGCALPASLRAYHLHLGVRDSAENLLNPVFNRLDPNGMDLDAIGPIAAVFPGVADIVEQLDAQAAATLTQQLGALVAFGDYLGNGNLWCFHRVDGSVWYLDHDTAPLLTRVFDDVASYLDALAIMSWCEAHATDAGRDDGDEVAETLLVQRLGEPLVRKWRY